MHEYVAQLRQDDRRSSRTIRPLVAQFQGRRLTWWPQLGIGYYPVEVGIEPYDQAYFERFDRQAQTSIGRALMVARHDFVERHYQGILIDVGIGSGAFVALRRRYQRVTYGYDVNPAGMQWLDKRMLLVDPYLVPFPAMTLWDVIEHIGDFQLLLANVLDWVFLSLPIFRDAEHVLRSKHFRPDEHHWYFTRDGLLFAMKLCGFALVSESTVETELGREDIGTFAFKRDRA
jgi:hypothetical protein